MQGVYIGILLCWRRAGWLGSVNIEQFNGRAVFDYERDADAVGWAVGRNQDFAASQLGGEISHFKRNVRNSADEIRDRRVRFETHPLHAKFAFLVADDKEFQVFQVRLARLRFSSGNSDVMVLAHIFRSPWNSHKFYAVVMRNMRIYAHGPRSISF